MTTELQIFRSEDFGSVRTLYRDGEPWFVAADVCRALEIKNPRDAITRLDDDEKDAVVLTDAMSRPQVTNIINEFGLYNLILGSRKPEAKAFKRWITHEVIPAIRRDGTYSALPQEETDDLPLTDTRREYLHAARSIAMASSQSLPLVRTLLQRAGIDTAPALPQKTPDTFRARLKVTIESLGLDIEDAAEIIGMSMDLMRRYMKGYVPSQPMQETAPTPEWSATIEVVGDRLKMTVSHNGEDLVYGKSYVQDTDDLGMMQAISYAAHMCYKMVQQRNM